MRRNNKKGFTIVELIIVIAVIAILAGVLIPTFAGIVSKANASKALQEAQNAYKEAYALAIADGKIEGVDADKKPTPGTEVQEAGDFTFTFTGSLESLNAEATETPDNFDYTVDVSNKGVVTVTKKTAANAGSSSSN